MISPLSFCRRALAQCLLPHQQTVLSKILTRDLASAIQCDGVEPNPCSKCVQRRITCAWEPHTKESKDDLIQQIMDLQSRNKDITELSNKAEGERRDFQQTNEWQAIILQTMGQNGHDREIIKRLREGQSYQNIADWLVAQDPNYQNLGLEPSTHHTLTEAVRIFEAQCHSYDGLQRTGVPNTVGTPWTSVTADHRLIGHLFDLYFTWIHPVHMLFSELDFKRDFRESKTSQATTYCSSSLVNAICAMACHQLDPEKIEERGFLDVRRGMNAATLREGFMEEAKKGLIPGIYNDMPSSQALAVMYLVEWSSGRARSALGYLRSATEGLKPPYGNQSEEAIQLTYWGIKTLVTYASDFTESPSISWLTSFSDPASERPTRSCTHLFQGQTPLSRMSR